jgi:hypothetical protein
VIVMRELKEKKELSIKLRKEGKSLNDICAIIKKGKGTVYPWIRNIDVKIKSKCSIPGNNILATRKMQRNYRIKREKVYEEYKKLAPKLLTDSKIRDFIVAYYCEGGKTIRHNIDFTNTDPSAHKLFIDVVPIFSRKELKFRLICHNCTDEMILFWKKELKIKGEIKVIEKGGNKSPNRSNFGTLQIRICDTYGKAKINALIDHVVGSWE